MKRLKYARLLLLMYLLMFALLPVLAVYGQTGDYDRMIDHGRIMTDDERVSVEEELDKVSEKHNCDVIAVTVSSLNGHAPLAAADDLFDSGGYGFGPNKDGILFLVSMNDREWGLSTHGSAIEAFTDAGQEYMASKIGPYLTDGKYEEAFKCYAELCDDYLKAYEKGEAIDSGNLPKQPISPLVYIGCLIGGGGIAGLTTYGLKKQLKSVRRQSAAADYIVPGSVNITRREDVFLYSRVTRVAKPKNNSRSGGGGSTTHTSSSGRTHGGSSGRF